ncbi:unnamed protein product [Parascedosporium putredinis]|uniref:Ankyrin repeat protein n=1 Tax=Parascedosporium putredinis TaxID=1442378 RepID=A0A9P1MA26_9PEZI|nr:unnamed protein product [Parascedosporium putredinis]CAI7996691.1 unnamed protein product [Parascedosporium putredinis]
MGADHTTAEVAGLDQQLIAAVRRNKPEEVVKLLEAGADINAVDEKHRQTPISLAAENGYFELLRTLYDRGADLECSDEDGWSPMWTVPDKGVTKAIDLGDDEGQTPLMLATKRGRDDNVQVLLEAGAEHSLLDNTRYSALCHASAIGHMAIIRRLFDHSRLNSRGAGIAQGFPPTNSGLALLTFIMAVAGNDDEWQSFGENAKLNFRLPDDDGHYAIHLAAKYGSAMGVERLAAVGSMNERDLSGNTPLVLASQTGQLAVVEFLLTKGADTNISDNEYGETPLMWAAENGHVEVVRVLCSKGDTDAAQSSEECSALHFALKMGRSTCADALIEAGADLDIAEGHYGQSCLSWAAENGHLETVRFLIKAGAKMHSVEPCGKAPIQKDGLDVNLQDSQGRTPLSWAAQHGNVDCVQVLLDKGVAPDTPDKKRRTPLSWAAEHGNVDCVQVLLDKGVAPDTPDEKCRTPLSWAAEKGQVGPIPHLTDIDGGTRKDVVRDPEADDKLPSQGLTKYHQILERLKFPGSICVPERDKTKRDITPKRVPLGFLLSERPTYSLEKLERMRWVEPTPRKTRSWHKQNQDLNVAQGDAAPEDDGKGTRETAATQFRQQDEQQVNELPNDRDSHGRRSGMVLFKLYWRYLEEDHPLHPRRTLDQFYYHTLSDTKERDQDQTCVRYFNKKKGDLEGQTFELRRVLTMVDQLWMWILPACGTAPPTVITAFPQRSDRMACKDPKRMPALVSNIVDILRDILRGPLPCPSVEELTEIIATECSRIYFDTMSNRHELTQFLQIYTTSIGDITEGETRRFRKFQKSIRDLKEFEEAKHAKAAFYGSKPEPPEMSMDIEEDIEDLRKIKDIRDELNILLSSALPKRDGTDRQGKTIMYFTLPLSFMSSFLTIEIDEFPRSEGGNLKLGFVLTVVQCQYSLSYPRCSKFARDDKRTRISTRRAMQLIFQNFEARLFEFSTSCDALNDTTFGARLSAFIAGITILKT